MASIRGRFRRTLPLIGASLLTLGGCDAPQQRAASIGAADRLAGAVRGEAQALGHREIEPAGALGLEVRWWVVDDAGRDLFHIAASHNASLDFVSSTTRDELAAHGFRLLRLPSMRFRALAEELSISTEISNDWLGQSFRWTGVMAGPWLSDHDAVRIGERRLPLPPGRFDLAVRSWLVPTGGEPYLHLELLPRYEPTRERSLASLAGESQRRRPVVEAHTRLRLERGYMYLLTAESPLVDWTLPEPLTELDEDSSVSDDETQHDAATAWASQEDDAIRPPALVTPTVGQLLLQNRVAADFPGRGRRAVAVFLPHLPAEASLLPAMR